MGKKLKVRFLGRSALSIGLISLFFLFAFTAATHSHFPLGGEIQQECRLCVAGGLRQIPTPTSFVFFLPLIFLILVIIFSANLPRPFLQGEAPTRSPPFFS